jgi:hypothetical protein
MHRTIDSNRARGRARGRSIVALLIAFALVAAACGGDDDTAADPAPASENESGAEPVEADEPDAEPADDPEPADDDDAAEPEPEADLSDVAGSAVFPLLDPPTGEPLKIGLVNTEGVPGLDFPDIRINIGATFDYLNQHGGYGGRPLELVNCTAAGSPETSQVCAQEMVGNNVELVLLGLDLFPDYATYTAADLPVIGMLPILPGDYSADALFMTGGNATTMGTVAAVADQHFAAKTVGIVSADNVGANASAASLTASLDIAGIEYTLVKGGDNETDAGYQGLMRQAAEGDPDLLISLYADAGCIGTIRGRASLGIEIPVVTTSICAETAVIEEVGDDALGWIFAGIQTDEDTPEKAIIQDIMAPALGVEPEEVDPNALGLGGLGLIMAMSLAEYSNALVADGGELTGASLYDYMATTSGLIQWPSGAAIDCGAAPSYPTICSFTFPFAEYQEGGGVVTVPGLEAVSAIDYLP